jgi:hypothetical protein
VSGLKGKKVMRITKFADRRQAAGGGRWTADGRWWTADSERWTADGRPTEKKIVKNHFFMDKKFQIVQNFNEINTFITIVNRK